MTVVMFSRWRALLMPGLILAGTVIAVASLYPRLQLPDVGEGSDFVTMGAGLIVPLLLACPNG